MNSINSSKVRTNDLYSNVLYSNVLYSNVLYSNVLYSNVLYSNVLYSNVLYILQAYCKAWDRQYEYKKLDDQTDNAQIIMIPLHKHDSVIKRLT